MPASAADHIVLDGTTLLVESLVAGKSISEFTTGLKVGRATYDDRQHAFFLVLDDFSGGFGHRTLDVREDLGTHWDNPGGVDLRRGRQITLPPKRYIVSPNTQPTSMILSSEILDGAALGVPSDDSAETTYFYYGAGNSIYRMGDDRDTLTLVKVVADPPVPAARVPTKATRMFLQRGGDNVLRLYVIFANGALDARYWYSSNFGAASPTWTEGARFLWDAIPFTGASGQKVIVGQSGGFEFTYSKTALAALTDWNIDDPNPEISEPLWRPHSICRFVGEAEAFWGSGVPALYFIDYGDGRLYALDFYLSQAYPINVGEAHYLFNGVVWQGQIAVTDGWEVWLYAPAGGGGETVRHIGLFGRDGVPDSLRSGRYRIVGLVDGGDLLFAIAERTAGNKAGGTTIGFMVFVYNGAGWSLYYPQTEAAQSSTTSAVNPIAAVIDRFPVGVLAAANVASATTRALNILCQTHPSSALVVQLHSLRWPLIGKVPIAGTDEFEGGARAFRTGWFDGGFKDLRGALFYLKADLREGDTTYLASVSYRLDDDETAAFVSLGTATVRGTTILQFDATNEAGVEFRSVQFEIILQRTNQTTLASGMTDVQTTVPCTSATKLPASGIAGIATSGVTEFIEYSSKTGDALNVATGGRGVRGSAAAAHSAADWVESVNLTPELLALTLCYRKRAPLRQTWVARIDVDKMVEQDILVDTNGNGTPDTAATHQNVWDFLQTVWGKQTLVQLVIPQAEEAAVNLRVEIADMTLKQDDNREAQTVKGRIDLTLIQPIRAE